MRKIFIEGKDPVDLVESDFFIDETNIDGELCQLGKKMLHYGYVEGLLKVEVEQKKSYVDQVEAALDSALRIEAKANQEKVTEAQIRGQIKQHDQFREAVSSQIESQKNYNLARSAMVSLSAKRDALIALAYRDRQLQKADQW